MAQDESTSRAKGSGDRHIASGVRDVVVAAPLFITAPLYRHWHLRWGATDAEVAGEMPGDDIVPEAGFNTTRAITIAASPDAVWPWIAQLGFGRAGFYSYDLFDNAGRPSAHRILDEFQHPQVGDWVPMASKVNETTAFKIKAFKPYEWMLWEKPDSTWAWKLVPLAGGCTRLITRLKQHNDWGASPVMAALTVILFEFGDYPMMRKLLLGVKARAEARARSSAPSDA
jgi:hypothetical protein